MSNVEKNIEDYDKKIKKWSIRVYLFQLILAAGLVAWFYVNFKSVESHTSGFALIILLFGVGILLYSAFCIVFVAIFYFISKILGKNKNVKKMKENGTYYLIFGLIILILDLLFKGGLFLLVISIIHILFSFKIMISKK